MASSMTAEEKEALAFFYAGFEAKFDGSVEDELMLGWSQAFSDAVLNNRAMDRYEVERAAQLSRPYAVGYIRGRSMVASVLRRMRGLRAFHGDKGFSAVEHYGVQGTARG